MTTRGGSGTCYLNVRHNEAARIWAGYGLCAGCTLVMIGSLPVGLSSMACWSSCVSCRQLTCLASQSSSQQGTASDGTSRVFLLCQLPDDCDAVLSAAGQNVVTARAEPAGHTGKSMTTGQHGVTGKSMTTGQHGVAYKEGSTLISWRTCCVRCVMCSLIQPVMLEGQVLQWGLQAHLRSVTGRLCVLSNTRSAECLCSTRIWPCFRA